MFNLHTCSTFILVDFYACLTFILVDLYTCLTLILVWPIYLLILIRVDLYACLIFILVRPLYLFDFYTCRSLFLSNLIPAPYKFISPQRCFRITLKKDFFINYCNERKSFFLRFFAISFVMERSIMTSHNVLWGHNQLSFNLKCKNN